MSCEMGLSNAGLEMCPRNKNHSWWNGMQHPQVANRWQTVLRLGRGCSLSTPMGGPVLGPLKHHNEKFSMPCHPVFSLWSSCVSITGACKPSLLYKEKGCVCYSLSDLNHSQELSPACFYTTLLALVGTQMWVGNASRCLHWQPQST